MENFNPYLKEADSYYRVVDNNMKKNKKLGNKVLFSIGSMVIEKYLVALLMAEGIAISGHSTNGLIAKVKKHYGEIPDQLNALNQVDSRMDLCSLDAVSTPDLNDEEIKEFTQNLEFLKAFVYEQISKTEAV